MWNQLITQTENTDLHVLRTAEHRLCCGSNKATVQMRCECVSVIVFWEHIILTVFLFALSNVLIATKLMYESVKVA